jgi:hypothetical protein
MPRFRIFLLSSLLMTVLCLLATTAAVLAADPPATLAGISLGDEAKQHSKRIASTNRAPWMPRPGCAACP